MDGSGTAIEQYFNQLINMKLLTQIVVSDRQGNTIVVCFGNIRSSELPESSPDGVSDGVGDDLPVESNVVLSGSRCLQNLEQLHLNVPSYISLQYHDDVVVQTVDGCCMLTLIGSRSQGHFVGGLLTLLPQIRSLQAYQELLEKVQDCF